MYKIMINDMTSSKAHSIKKQNFIQIFIFVLFMELHKRIHELWNQPSETEAIALGELPDNDSLADASPCNMLTTSTVSSR